MTQRHHMTEEFAIRVTKLPTLKVGGMTLVPINRSSNDTRKNGIFLLTDPIRWAIPGGGSL